MPAIGTRGSTRRLTGQGRARPRPRKAPRQTGPPKWVGPSPLTGAKQQPFSNPQIKAKRQAKRAQRGVPAVPVPHLPDKGTIPTRRETRAAVAAAQHAQGSSRLRAHEIATDPRLRQFRRSLARYTVAQQIRDAVAEGSRAYTGSQTLAGGPRPRGLGIRSAFAIGARTPALQTPQSRVQAYKMAKRGGSGTPLAAASHLIGSLLPKVAPGLVQASKEIHPEISLGHTLDAATKDIKGIASVPFVGGYELLNALTQAAGTNTATRALADIFSGGGYEAARALGVGGGKTGTQSLETLGKNTWQGFKEGAGGKVLEGDFAGAARYIREHPVIGPLEVAPLVGVPGRVLGTAGRLSRLADLGTNESKLARAVNRVRAPIAIEPNEPGIARTFQHQPKGSPDLIRGLIQQYLDERRTPMYDARNRPIMATRGRYRVPVRAAREGRFLNEANRLAGRRANYRSSALAAETREIRHKTRERELLKLGPKLKGVEKDIVQPAGEAIIRSVKTWDEDVGKKITDLKAKIADPVAADLDELGLDAAKANLKKWEAAAKLPVKRRHAVIKAAEARAVHAFNPEDEALAATHYAPEARLVRSRYSGAGLAHVEGARYGEAVTPETIAERDQLKAAHKERKGDVKDAERDLGKAERHLTRVTTRQSSHRMKGEQPGARAATKKEKATKAEAEAAVKDAKQRVKDAENAAHEAENAIPRKPRKHVTLVDAEGRHIPNSQIEKVLEDAGRDPSTVHYLPHRVDPQLKRSYFRHLRPNERPGAGGGVRQGIVQTRGEQTISRELGVDELTNKRVTRAATRHYDEVGREAGVSSPAYMRVLEKERNGEDLSRGEQALLDAEGRGTYREMQNAARDLKRAGRGDWEVWKITGPRMGEAEAAELGSTIDTSAMEALQHGMLKERGVDDGTGGRNYVLVPTRYAQRLRDQAAPVSKGVRVGQLLNTPFRLAVLPQLRWLTGNFIEPYLVRMPLAGGGLLNMPGMLTDVLAARKLLKHMEGHADPRVKAAGAKLRALFGEGMFIGGRQSQVHTRAEDFGGTFGSALKILEAPFRKEIMGQPVLKQFGQLILALPHAFFWFNRHIIENPAQMAALGKSARRELQLFTGNWHSTVKIGEKALDELSHGLTDTATQHRFVREMHELLGQYDGFGPGVRHLIQSYTPFLPWTLASMRFVFWTFPIHKTNSWVALLKAGQSVLPEWEAQHKPGVVPPGDLQYAPMSKGGYVDAARYTPYGISIPLTTEGPQILAETIGPQLRGPLNALFGKDPFGRDLELHDRSTPSPQDKELIALYSLLGGFVPGLSLAQRIKEGGGTGYSDSTIFKSRVKPGTTHQSGWNRALNPFRPTYLKGPSGTSELSPHQEAQLEHEAERSGAGELSPAEEARLEAEAEKLERR